MSLRIVIFGATGRTGRELVTQALSGGHLVTAYVRNPAKITCTHERLFVVTGDISDFEKTNAVIKNQHVVISALGASSPFKFDPAVTNGFSNIIKAMERHHTQRLIYLSFAGVTESRNDAGFLIRCIAPGLLLHEIRGHEAREKMIIQSSLPWIIVRPATLTNRKHTKEFRSGEHIRAKKIAAVISRADVAGFMLEQLSGDTFLRKKPLIMY